MFPHIEYLEWMQGRPDVAMYDLGSTDLRGVAEERPSTIPPALEGRDDPPVGATLEMQIASEYGVDPEQVLVTAGASHANFLATATALDADPESERDDDEHLRALVEKPGYEPHRRTPAAFDAAVDRFIREDDYRLEPERVEKALTSETALVTVTNRHNPTGRLAERETLEAVAERAREYGARLLVDEVYAPFVTDEQATGGALGGPTAAGIEGVAVTGSLTKFLGLGDLRVGWLVADADFVDRAREVSHHVPAVSDVSRAYGMRAFHHLDDIVADQRAMLEENTALLAEFVEERDDLTGFVAPGSTYAFLHPTERDAESLQEDAWENGLLLAPGRFFDDESAIRVSLGRAPPDMAVALRALGELLDAPDSSNT
ncbi:pyridoxal phosphate-dependent aminotransferase [Halarchaeum sp. CBA1220]|uniref:pyridoxal phosphate-dependent aminotransferase n=1 Tax=Halarchaeum sp. CBA1220 TaxID=1853682 RepID=UPI000F3A8F18|nr:pyridoxal phosphate-dependent aminotransferase [Halarchaeum sp. CBA1220]QLC34544.1 pyridoxal phosphate-dependent aminotransferase [Halarchaeum sp. CBA1220]